MYVKKEYKIKQWNASNRIVLVFEQPRRKVTKEEKA
jgi:hypothetical protein